jgi:phosphoserine phosphatase
VNEMVERVTQAFMDGLADAAKAPRQALSDLAEAERAIMLAGTRAAIAAVREPTEAMLGAHEAVCVFRSQDEREDYRENLREAWSTMISAALEERETDE